MSSGIPSRSASRPFISEPNRCECSQHAPRDSFFHHAEHVEYNGNTMTDAKQTSPHLLVRAARGDKIERPPVWAMRQAGRWDPEFNKLRAGLSFYEFSENIELAIKTSLLPKRFGVDAIILFYDITTLTVSMGLPFTLQPGKGPVPDKAVTSMPDLDRLDPQPDPARFRHVRELLARVRGELRGELPVIVFAGAPF